MFYKEIRISYRFRRRTVSIRMIKHHSVINHVTITSLLGQVNLGNSRVRIHHTKQCHVHHNPPICWVAVHPNRVFQCKGCYQYGVKMTYKSDALDKT